MPIQDERSSLGKRSLEDIAATQGEHTLFLSRIVEALEEMRREQNNHTNMLRAQGELLREILTKLDERK